MLILPNISLRPHQRFIWRKFFGLLKELRDKGAKGLLTTGMITFVLALHRRAGKDVLAFNIAIYSAYWDPGTYVISLPTMKQAKSIYLDGVLKDGRPFTSMIPDEILIKIDRQDSKIYIRNHLGGVSTIILTHNHADSLVGLSVNGIIMSEFAVSPSDVLQYMSQSITEKLGWALVISTPRGKNQFYELYEKNAKNQYGMSIRMGIEQTKDKNGQPLFTKQDIERDLKSGLIESWQVAEQEMYVSWTSANDNAFYREATKVIDEQNRNATAIYNPGLPIYAAFDYGRVDRTVITFGQYDPRVDAIHILGIYHNNYHEIHHYIDEMEAFCIRRGWGQVERVMSAHDGKRHTLNATESIDEIFYRRGYEVVEVPRITDKMEAINEVRRTLRKCHFNSESNEMLEHLKQYQKVKNRVTGEYESRPLHDKSSDFADSFDCLLRGIKIEHAEFQGYGYQNY